MTEDFCFAFFDLETRKDTILVDDRRGEVAGTFEHVPVLCVTQITCKACSLDTAVNAHCEVCHREEKIFEGEQCVSEFVDFLATIAKKFRNVYVLAHNMKSFDGSFVLKDMMRRLRWTPTLKTSGCKIQMMKYVGI
jgi:hypothetical protein